MADDERARRDRFEVVVGTLAVATTLVAAGIGFLLAIGSNEADEASARAESELVEARSRGEEIAQQVEAELRLFELSREQRARAQHAAQLATLGDKRAREAARAEQARWTQLADGTDERIQSLASESQLGDIALGSASEDSALYDPFFPQRFRGLSQQPVLHALALRDAENERSAFLGKRTASYAAILTILAVALYLFGFSLAREARPIRGLFAFVGLVFLLLGAIFGPIRALSPTPSAPESAAEEYAAGVVQLNVAIDPQDYQTAIEHLSEAIRQRPSFADAYVQRSGARFLRDSPQFTAAPSLTPPETRRQVISDLRMARELGDLTPSTAGDLGFNLMALGLQLDRPGLFEESLSLTREALDQKPNDALLTYNLAAGLLASGRTAEAREAYEEAIRLTIADLKRDPFGFSVDWVSGALSDLELIRRYAPASLVSEVSATQVRIAGSYATESLHPGGSERSVGDVTVTVLPGSAKFNALQWRKPALSSLDAQWFYNDPGDLGWSQLSQISGEAFLSKDLDRSLYGIADYISIAGAKCLPPGRYRVDLYDKGELVGQGQTAYSEKGGFTPFVDPSSGIIGCIPSSWVGHRIEAGAAGGAHGFASADGRRRVYLLRLDGPIWSQAPGSSLDFLDPLPGSRLGQMIQSLGCRTPHDPLGEKLTTGTGFDQPPISYLCDKAGAIWALANSQVDYDGSITVAVVSGPRRFFENGLRIPEKIIGSLTHSDFPAKRKIGGR
jgi:tetratricopeptide (TPR) repeat protein